MQKLPESEEASGKDEADLQAEDSDRELQALEEEMQEVNAEYTQVLTTAGEARRTHGHWASLTPFCDTTEELYAQLQATIRSMLDEHHQLSSGLIQD